MADIIKKTSTVEYEFSLGRDFTAGESGNEPSDTTKRSISLPLQWNTPAATAEHLPAMREFANWALSGASTLIQTANWRDDDDDEAVWVTTAITPVITFKEEYRLDPNES